MGIVRIPLPRFQLSCDWCGQVADQQGDGTLHFISIEFAVDWAAGNGWLVPSPVQLDGFTCPGCRVDEDEFVPERPRTTG